MMARRVLVVGGTGTFGSRLVQGLITQTQFDVIIAGRSLIRAETFSRQVLSGQTCERITALEIDTATVTADQLSRSGAFMVVDAAGPFQDSKGRLVRATIEAGLHYIDLADARDFVVGFSQFDDAAKQAGVLALTGASSTPALSNAVIAKLTENWRAIHKVEIAICPGNRANPRGLAVIQSILSYAGKAVRVFDNGHWVDHPGWGLLTRKPIPGLGYRWLSLCETPDLDLVVRRFGVTESVIFRAGLEFSALHLGLWVASLAVRSGWVGSLHPLAQTCQAILNCLARFGGERSGMIVDVLGQDPSGKPIRAMWTLLAENCEGLFVPTLPALAAIRLIGDGRLRQTGALTCDDALPFAAIEEEFKPYGIRTRIEIERPTQ